MASLPCPAGPALAQSATLALLFTNNGEPLENPENEKLTDMTPREMCVIGPLLLLIVIMGVYPKPFLERIESSVAATVERATATAVAERPSARVPELKVAHAETVSTGDNR